ncbi:MAG: hypothetical protein JXQ80_12030 [Bacteroidales bacterium]|nr:hypothetical protein [Bacteroidales bacterium]
MDDLNNSSIENTSMEFGNEAIQHLNETRKWTMFLSILGFVLLGLMLISVLFVLAAGSSRFPQAGIAGGFAFLMMLIICAVYFFPIYFQYQFSALSKQAILNKDSALLTKAMQYLKMQFKYLGILVIVLLSIYLIIIMIAIAAGSFFSLFH